MVTLMVLLMIVSRIERALASYPCSTITTDNSADLAAPLSGSPPETCLPYLAVKLITRLCNPLSLSGCQKAHPNLREFLLNIVFAVR